MKIKIIILLLIGIISVYLLFKLNKLKFKKLKLNQSILNLFSKSTSSENFNNQLITNENDNNSNHSLISGLKNFTWSGNNMISKSFTELESDDSSLYSDDTDDNTVYSDITNDETSDVDSISDNSENVEVTLSSVSKSNKLTDNNLSTPEKKKSSCGCNLNSISESIDGKVIETFSDLLPDNKEIYSNMGKGEKTVTIDNINYLIKSRIYSDYNKFIDEVKSTPWYDNRDKAKEFAVLCQGNISGFNSAQTNNRNGPHFIYYTGATIDNQSSNMKFIRYNADHSNNDYVEDLSMNVESRWNQRYVAYVVSSSFDNSNSSTATSEGDSSGFSPSQSPASQQSISNVSPGVNQDSSAVLSPSQSPALQQSITNVSPRVNQDSSAVLSPSQSPASQQSITNVSPENKQDSTIVLSPSQSPASQHYMSDEDDLDEDDEEIDELEDNNRINIEKSPNSSTISTKEFESSEIQLDHISNNLDKINDNLTDSYMIDGDDEETNDISETNRYKTVENMLNQYMIDNKECNDKLLNDLSYEKQFSTSYKNYVSKKFKEHIGKVPDFSDVDSLNDNEFNHYINIIKNLPKCGVLMNNYDTNVGKSILNSLNYNSVESSNISRSSNQIRNRYDHNTDFDNTDKLRQNQEILDNLVKTSEEKLFVDADNTENKMFNDKVNTVEVGESFNYKPNIKFDHNEPSIKTASAYGWSYMPPQTWSVPQKRPPVCIPDHDTQSTVKAIYDKGTPVDALDWVKSGAILPQNEYTEKYNENYYYPGWKAQEHINYPFKDGNKGPQEYYNYNLANKIE